jgi:hypothetical protein
MSDLLKTAYEMLMMSPCSRIEVKGYYGEADNLFCGRFAVEEETI